VNIKGGENFYRREKFTRGEKNGENLGETKEKKP